MHHQTIAEKIIALKKEDESWRKQLIKKGQLGQGYDPEMERIHIKNAQILDNIICKIGYPTEAKVGKEACAAAWLVIQHAISQPSFMKKCVLLLKQEVDQENANPVDLAYLSDRIATLEGKLQAYGTQFDWNEKGVLKPLPMEKRSVVNQKRKALGLPTVEKQTQLLQKRAMEEGQQPPDDFFKRKKEMEEWKKKVGWIG